MDASLVIIGLNFRSAPVAVRERFWMSPPARTEALQQLVRSEGIDEAMALVTCNRTEFILWASDPTEGANSLLRFLTREFNLKLSEWSNFYRLVDDTALLHLFRVTAGLDSMVLGEPEIVGQVKEAWQLAQQAGSTGRFLDAVMQKTLTVSKRARTETAIAASAVSVPYASVELSAEIFGSLTDRKVVLLGAGKMSELAARYLMNAGAHKLTVINRTLEKAQALADQLGGRAASWNELLPEVFEADIVVSSTSSPTHVLTKSDLESIVASRQTLPLVVIDIAVPRDIEPSVGQLTGVYLYNMDDLERVVQQNTAERRAAGEQAEKILHEELQGFRRRLMSEQVVPTIVALRHRLEEICGQELRSLEDQFGPFTEDQQHALHSLASHITQRIAGTMARELKELPERADQQQLTEAVQRLFHLQPAGRPSVAQRN